MKLTKKQFETNMAGNFSSLKILWWNTKHCTLTFDVLCYWCLDDVTFCAHNIWDQSKPSKHGKWYIVNKMKQICLHQRKIDCLTIFCCYDIICTFTMQGSTNFWINQFYWHFQHMQWWAGITFENRWWPNVNVYCERLKSVLGESE